MQLHSKSPSLPSSPSGQARGRQRSAIRVRPLVVALISAGYASVSMAQLSAKSIGDTALPDTSRTINLNEVSRTSTETSASVKYQQTADRGVLESFNQYVGAKASVEFATPSKNAVTVWRGVGQDAAYIFGNVSSNGRLFVVNPNGIYVGSGGSVSASSVVLSALDLDPSYVGGNSDYAKFLAQPHVVFNSDRSGYGYGSSVIEVADGAHVTATDGGGVMLVGGRGVRNQGDISVGLGGDVTLVAGAEVGVDIGDSGFIKLVSTTYDGQEGRTVINAGSIDAPNGTVTLKTSGYGYGNIFDEDPTSLTNLVNAEGLPSGVYNSGNITAKGSNGGQGRVVMAAEGNGAVVANSGKVDVSAADAQSLAGSILLSAENVLVGNVDEGGGAAQLLADGPRGGGDITLNNLAMSAGEGGTSTEILVLSSALLSANATNNGNGGIIKLSTMDGLSASQIESGSNSGRLSVYGQLEAQGGVNGGHGGKVETSGTYVNVNNADQGRATIKVGARAAGAAGGSWVLYSPNITIGSSTPSSASGIGLSETYVNQDDINLVLNSGSSVGMATSYQGNANVPGGSLNVESGTQIVQSAGGGGNSLTLQSHGDLIVGADTTISSSSGSLNVALLADANGRGQGSLLIRGGQVIRDVERGVVSAQAAVPAPVTINTNGGNLDLQGARAVPLDGGALPVNSNAGVAITGAVINTQGSSGRGDVSINGAGGATRASNASTETAAQASQDGVTIDTSTITAGNVNIQGNSASGTGVKLNETTISTDKGVIDIRGVSQGGGAAAALGQPIGVDIGTNVVLNAGQGSVRILGRGVREAVADAASLDPAYGVRIADLTVTTSGAAGQQITIVGQSVGSTGAGVEVTSTGQGIKVQDQASTDTSPLASTADVIIGGSADTVAPLALNLRSPVWNTTGRLNFRPAGVTVNSDGQAQLAEALTQAIRVGTSAGAVATNFIVDPGWFNKTINPGLTGSLATVIGSDAHTGQISVENAALDGAGVVTLQNQGAGSAGIALGTQAGQGVQTLSLVTSGNVSQSGALKAGTLSLVVGPQSVVTLNNAGNQIGVLNQANGVQASVAGAQSLPSSRSGIPGYSTGQATFQSLSVNYERTERPDEPDRDFERPEALQELRTDVYVRGQFTRPQLCTPANTSGTQTTAAANDIEPLAMEWTKVRRGAQLTNCSGVQADSNCSAF